MTMDFLKSYFNVSSLHCLRYLGGKEKIPFSHRLLWILKTITACVLCGWMCVIFTNNYNDTHTITGIESNMYPVRKIWFPCVTICNINKVSRNNFQRITNILLSHDIERTEIEKFGYSLSLLSSFSTFDYSDKIVENFTRIFDTLNMHNYTMDTIMQEVHQHCEELLFHCRFKSHHINCSESFHTIKSMEGYCCSFNYHGPGHFFSNTAGLEKVSGSGIDSGITVVLDINPDDYMSPSKPHYGAIIMVSDPTDFPEISVKSTIAELNGSVYIQVTPSYMDSTLEVKHVSLRQRLCKFPQEVSVKSASRYSFQTCITECKINAIYNICNCIPYFYPNSESRRTCYLRDMNCLIKNKGLFNSIIFSNSESFSFGIVCDCMPECSGIFYSMNSVQQNIEKTLFASNIRNVSLANKSIVTIAYPKNTCIKYVKDVFLYWNDVLAMYGGVFSLCIGASMMSIFELLYELIVYLFCIKRKTKLKPKRINYPFLK